MKANIPRSYQTLPRGEKKKIADYAQRVACDAAALQSEKDARIMLDLYIKMVCVTLHDAFHFGEDELLMFLGNHRRLFERQSRMVKDDTQISYLNRRMEEIFPKDGFPKAFFDDLLGDIEKADLDGDTGVFGVSGE